MIQRRRPALSYCRVVGLGRPDRDFQLADRQRLAQIALGVGAEEPDVQVVFPSRKAGWAISSVLELLRVRLSTTSE